MVNFKKPIISIIVPVFNMHHLLQRCLNSLLQQTFKDIEVICIDDGSSDNSPQILAEFAKSDCRVRLFTQQNKGYPIALNAGLELSRGDYIGFCDPDDFADPQMYERLFLMINTPGSDVAVVGHFKDSYAGSIAVLDTKRSPYGLIVGEDFLMRVCNSDHYASFLSGVCNKLFSSKFFLKKPECFGLRFDERYSYGPDMRISSQIALLSSGCIYDSRPYYHYWQHEDSMVNSLSKTAFLNRMSDISLYYYLYSLTFIKYPNSDIVPTLQKRFVYAASRWLEQAQNGGYTEYIAPLKSFIYQYLPVYKEQNKLYPERLKRMEEILHL